MSNLIPSIAILLLLIVEWILQLTWNRLYYTTGIRLFTWETQVSVPMTVLPTDDDLRRQFADSPLRLLLFRSLDPNHIAFRENAWGNGRRSSRAVMHGLMEFDPDRSAVRVIGYLNWSMMLAVLLAVLWIVHIEVKAPILIVFTLSLAVGGWMLLRQKRDFIAVAEFVVDKWFPDVAERSVSNRIGMLP